MNLPDRVKIREAGPRDGLQMEHNFVPTERKIELVNALSDAGLSRIQATSFVHPKAIPNLADAAEVMAGIKRKPGVEYDVLVPNLKGAERAVEVGVDGIELILSASDSHNMNNVNRTIEQSLEGFGPIMELAARAGIPVAGSLSTSFGCPFEGKVPPEQVERLLGELLSMGMSEVLLGDTTGMANPRQVYRLVDRLLSTYPNAKLIMHFHDTRGAGLANVVAALQAGATVFDGSVGGMGGCPFAPGASGNVATEDMVHMLHQMDIDTGIDLDKLISCARLAQEMVGRELPGQVMKAGTCVMA